MTYPVLHKASHPVPYNSKVSVNVVKAKTRKVGLFEKLLVPSMTLNEVNIEQDADGYYRVQLVGIKHGVFGDCIHLDYAKGCCAGGDEYNWYSKELEKAIEYSQWYLGKIGSIVYL